LAGKFFRCYAKVSICILFVGLALSKKFIFMRLFLLFSTLILNTQVIAQDFKSKNTKATLIELYTSQGCSSCPPAEKWLNQLTANKNLWQDLVPLAFHVDYWDYLGWHDVYARSEYSKRQRDYYTQGKTTAVYTPGFVLNGKQWTAWRFLSSIPSGSSDAGIIKANLTNNKIQAEYSKPQKNLQLNVALLGFGIKTKIHRGENAGTNLP